MRFNMWIISLIVLCLASCFPFESRVDTWNPQNKPLKFNLIPAEDEGSYRVEAQDPDYDPPVEAVFEHVPGPIYVGRWTIYRFPRRISIPDVEDE